MSSLRKFQGICKSINPNKIHAITIRHEMIYPSCDQKENMIYSLQFIKIPEKDKYRKKKKINKSIKRTRRIYSGFIYIVLLF